MTAPNTLRAFIASYEETGPVIVLELTRGDRAPDTVLLTPKEARALVGMIQDGLRVI